MLNPVEYLNSTVLAKIAPSPIHGVGVFAIQDIKEGQLICNQQFLWFTLSPSEFEQLVPEVQELILQRTLFKKSNPIHFATPNQQQVMQAFMNHSSSANSDGKIALRDIKKGEEITEDFTRIAPHMNELSMQFNKKNGIIQ